MVIAVLVVRKTVQYACIKGNVPCTTWPNFEKASLNPSVVVLLLRPVIAPLSETIQRLSNAIMPIIET